MLVVWNEVRVGASQVLVDWNQVSFGWNAAGVGDARDASDDVEVFDDWNEDVIVGQGVRPNEVGVQWSDVGVRGVRRVEAGGSCFSRVLTRVCLPGAVVALD